MGLLFSSLLVILAIAIFAIFSFFVTLFFLPPAWAIRSAAMFVVGTVSGAILSAALSLLVVGVGATFISSSQVVAYLSLLALGGLLSGSLLLWLFIKSKRSKPTFRRNWLKPAP